jgi:uncharacterized protein (TIGR03437 family)
LFKRVLLVFAGVLLATPAFAASSVFGDLAFAGQFSIALFDASNRPIKNSGGDSFFLVFIPEAEGVSLINSLGDPGFNANNCPGLQEKREYYRTPDGTHVGCTNGSSFNLRIRVGSEQGGIRPNDKGDTGVVRFTDITTGPPATATGTGSSNNTPSFKVVLTYSNGGSGTPFARVPEDYMLPVGSTPVVGTTLTPGSTQNLNLNVRYRLTSTKNGTLQGTLYNDGQVLATTTAANTSSLSGENTQGFNFSSLVVPNSGNLTLRGELRVKETGVVVASSSVVWPIFQAPPLTAAPNMLRFNSTAGTTKQADSITVISTSASPLAYTASIVNASKWLSLSAATGSISASATLPLTMDPTGLAPGYYFDTVRIATSLGTLSVPIALQVGTRPASLNVEPNGMRFDVRQGQGSPISQTLNVYHSGAGGTSSNWSARVLSGANLIRLSTTNGTATLGNPSPISVSLASTATDILGPSQAVIEVSSPNTPPEYVTVWANVTATTTPAPPILTPASLVLAASQGGAPVTQRVQVDLNELVPTNFTFNFSGGTNLTATAVTNSASTTSPGAVDVTFAPSASATIGGSGPIFFNVTSSNQLRTSRLILLTLPPAGAACVPGAVWVRETSLIERFSISAGLPQPLTVQLYDQCGNRLKGGSVAASFSNGDPSLRLEMDEATGDFFTTWTPQTALNAPMKVTLWPTFGNLFSKAFNINGTVTGNAAPPRLVSGGILNNLNPIVGAPVAPGTIAQVYGDNFYSGAGFESAPPPPLDPRLEGAQLLISGNPAPFYYLSKTQAAAQIPTELTPGRTYSALMEVNGVYSTPQSIEVVSATPGTVSVSGALVAQHAADYQLVTAQNPAKPGESLIMYLVGMGVTSPNVATGAPAPAGPLAQASVQPTVTIDGQGATVQFAGLTPGFAGLYQINFIVPATARDGDLDVVIKQDTATANPTKLTVKK